MSIFFTSILDFEFCRLSLHLVSALAKFASEVATSITLISGFRMFLVKSILIIGVTAVTGVVGNDKGSELCRSNGGFGAMSILRGGSTRFKFIKLVDGCELE